MFEFAYTGSDIAVTLVSDAYKNHNISLPEVLQFIRKVLGGYFLDEFLSGNIQHKDSTPQEIRCVDVLRMYTHCSTPVTGSLSGPGTNGR